MRWVAIGAAVVVFGCSSGVTPERGPDYTPANSAELESECPDEHKEAKAAREALLGNDSAAARAQTAKVVLAQADCERTVLAGGTFKPATHEAILAAVSEARNEQRDTANLYNEVATYGVPLYELAAMVGRGELSSTFSRRLAAIPTPTDMTATGEQAAFRNEVAALVDYFASEAERELRGAIDKSSTVAGADDLRGRACRELALLERQPPSVCGSGG